jgi:hypothetical protein
MHTNSKKNYSFFRAAHKTKLSCWFLLLFCPLAIFAQNLQSPANFLGYKLGDRYTPNYRLADYFRHLAATAPNVKLLQYGTTNEQRPLLLAFISSQKNIDKLEEIRQNNLKITGLQEGTPNGETPAIVWLSYGVHGNETSSTEAAMLTAYELLLPQNAKYLENTVILIDPCLNPDGRDRYVNWYMQMQGNVPNASMDARENNEPQPRGRLNHYLFDMNRDWAWQTQRETQQRMVVYNQWMPHIHADFHEMGINSTYYFAPAAEPYHTEITDFQRKFQVEIGKNHAKYFDKNNWLYYTKERFDLLYPSYGDSYPMFNGAIGMTYEQGGLGKGIAALMNTGDTLTLAQRIAHHHTTGLSTVEIASLNQKKLTDEFKKYFEAAKNPKGSYATFVVPMQNNTASKVKELLSFLDKHNIRYGTATAGTKTVNSLNYFTSKNENLSLQNTDIVIPAAQPKAALLRVLFNPKTNISDSLTYDATAWAVPYMFGVQAFACAEKIAANTNQKAAETETAALPDTKALAYLCEWKGFADLQFLCKLLKSGIQVRYAEKTFAMNNKTFSEGTLIILRADNQGFGSNFDRQIRQLAASSNQTLHLAETGFVNLGVDFGSDFVYKLNPPRVAVLSGNEVSPTAFGQIWHYFDELLKYQITSIDVSYFNKINLSNYDVLIMPDGSYSSINEDKLAKIKAWVKSGGRLIANEGANALFADNESFGLKKFKEEEEEDKDKKTTPKPKELLKKFGDRERNDLVSVIQGSIYKLELDNTHPLGFGYPNFYYTLRGTSEVFEFFKEGGWNVGVVTDNAYIDGFAGAKAKKKMKNSVVFGVEDLGNGKIVYLIDDVLFRNSWKNGFLLFGNAVFMTGW